jgi:hypothetical protein
MPQPTTGAAKKRSRAAEDAGTELRVELVHSRTRHLLWAVGGLAVGALLITKFGTVAQWLGVVLVAMGIWAAWSLARTVLYPPDAIIVLGDQVTLPRGVCRGKPDQVAREAIRHAYLLRRSVPFMRTAPVLVIETDKKAFIYPRDWFADEHAQLSIVERLAPAAT